VVRALAYLHEHGIVHNDVRPENVWLGDDGRVRLMSLENADSKDAPRNAAEVEDGSAGSPPFYQSPEQLLGDPTRAPSDVFALGVLLYRLLAGRLPWGDKDPASIRQAMRQNPPAPLGELGAEAPPGLERIVQRCLEKEAEQRFASARELELALGSLIEQTSAFEPEVSVRDVLARSGLLGEGAAPSLARALSSRLDRERQLKRALLALVLSALALSVGGLFFQRSALHESVRSGEPSTRPLADYGALRLVAEPWAHVFVDGQFMDTTPFAAPLLLTPGTHHVRLEHPQARPERRQVEVRAGESLFLDVQLQLYNAPRDGGAPLPLAVAPSADAGLPNNP
jgi:serine/threonine-protein kinase